MRKLQQLLAAVSLAAVAIAPLCASSSYSQSVTAVSSVTITAATSGFTSASYGVRSIVTGSPARKLASSEYSYSIDAGTYAIAISFPGGQWPSGFTGDINLKGLFPGPDTSAAKDWRPVLLDVHSHTVTVCPGCADSAGNFARRTVGGVVYVATAEAHADVSGSCDCWVYAYIEDNKLTFAHSVSASQLSASGGVAVTNTGLDGYATSYPAGALRIGRWHQSQGSFYLTLIADDRPW